MFLPILRRACAAHTDAEFGQITAELSIPRWIAGLYHSLGSGRQGPATTAGFYSQSANVTYAHPVTTAFRSSVLLDVVRIDPSGKASGTSRWSIGYTELVRNLTLRKPAIPTTALTRTV